MLRAPSPRTAVARLLIGGCLLAGAAVAGCGTPPELDRPAPPVLPAPPTPSPTPTGTPAVTGPASTGAGDRPSPTRGFDELVAVACAGRPSGTQVVELVRRTPDLLPRRARVTVRDQPRCAGDWQLTVIETPGREPLQVVSTGRPGALKLVTAGTDVCTVEVRAAAPPGIQTLAC